MPTITINDFWNSVEDYFIGIVESRNGCHSGIARIGVALIIDVAKEKDTDWINSLDFRIWCKGIGLHPYTTRVFLTRAIGTVTPANASKFKRIVEGL